MEKNLRSLFKISHNHRRQALEEESKLYFACRNGDINTVKEILPTIPYEELNHLESNGSTPLHVATYFEHLDIVHLLLHEYSCQRHLKDLNGFTAYELAHTNEMRQVYHRSSNENRFNDHSKQTFQIVSSSSSLINENDDDDIIEKPDQRYLTGYESNEEIKRQLDGLNGVKALFQSRIGRFIMEQGMKLKLAKNTGYNEEEYNYATNEKFRQESLKKILDEHVTSNHLEYKHCQYLLKEYIEKNTIESLLKLYTLETPFYSQLLILSNPLGFPFFIHLSDLKQRYYQGYSYRGVHLTEHELNEYRWAYKNEDNALSLVTFSSTSIIRDIAEQFSANILIPSNKISTLLIFYFPQPCDTAINLSEISEYNLPCISNYEDEKEVLIAPRTFFKVTQIEIDQSNEQCTIYLENISREQQTVFKAIKFFLKDDLKRKTNKLFHH